MPVNADHGGIARPFQDRVSATGAAEAAVRTSRSSEAFAPRTDAGNRADV